MTDDPFRCICDPDVIFEPPDPKPVAVEGCPAHRARRAYQQYVIRELAADPVTPVSHQSRLADFEREVTR